MVDGSVYAGSSKLRVKRRTVSGIARICAGYSTLLNERIMILDQTRRECMGKYAGSRIRTVLWYRIHPLVHRRIQLGDYVLFRPLSPFLRELGALRRILYSLGEIK